VLASLLSRDAFALKRPAGGVDDASWIDSEYSD
jgi:hypothetical protein